MKKKVYNKGVRPIVYNRSFKGSMVIHPARFETFPEKEADEIIKKFPNAVSESDYKKFVEEKKAAAAKATKAAETKTETKAE